MGRKPKSGSFALWGKVDTGAEGLLRGADMMLVETGVNWVVKQKENRRSRR